ncbi:MAG TPA: TIGR00730 family Rossman fold protein [Blastocatellia bacterium]
MKRICVFCGSSVGAKKSYSLQAAAVGRLIAENGFGLVYGGGKVGLMGVVADAALQAGAEVIGVIPQGLFAAEIAHSGLSKLRVVGSMQERKALMSDLSDAFIALPGGLGTFEEFCEIATWAQLGVHQKACAILNVGGYYDRLLGALDYAVDEGFLRPEYRGLIISDDDPARLIDRVLHYQPSSRPKWITRSEV